MRRLRRARFWLIATVRAKLLRHTPGVKDETTGRVYFDGLPVAQYGWIDLPPGVPVPFDPGLYGDSASKLWTPEERS